MTPSSPKAGSPRLALLALLQRFGLTDLFRELRVIVLRAARTITRADARLISNYLKTATAPRLQIGTGRHVLTGWLNTDYTPGKGIAFLDATRRFPFRDQTFDFIFSEHMIEHVPYRGGMSMLNECFRVLKPNGLIRLATPDMRFLIELYSRPEEGIHRPYMEWAAGFAPYGIPESEAIFVLNNFMRDWGHQFIWDEDRLRRSLGDVGFVDVTRKAVLESSHEELRNLEYASRMPEGFLRLESLVMEARKPGEPRTAGHS
jgi:predicted SAM-dependent methyltransferase